MEWLWWIAAALVLAVVEIITLTFVLIMFAGGALAAALAGVLGAPWWGQALVFVVTSLVLLLALRPWLLRHLKKRTPLIETNATAHIGRSAIVVAPVDSHEGRIKLAGEVWSARTEAAVGTLLIGQHVEVSAIDGATAVVRPLNPDTRPQPPAEA